MVVFLSGTEPTDEINPPTDGTLWSRLLDNHRQNSGTKYFSKHTLNSRMFSLGGMKDASSENVGPARLYIVSGGSLSRTLTLWLVFLFFVSLSCSGKVHSPGDCNLCFTSCNIIPAALLTTFEPVKGNPNFQGILN